MAVQFKFKAIGTTWQIDIYKLLNKKEEEDIYSILRKRIELFESTYSRFRENSLITKISKEAGEYIFPDDSRELFKLYRELYLKTEGYFTPLIGGLISDAGYDAEYTLKQKNELKAPPIWDDVMEYKDNKLIVKKPVLLDFGAAGKGYLIDLVARILKENLINEYCINAGGDIFYHNSEKIKVGLENPVNIKQIIGVYSLGNESICGSAGNRRAWGNFTHIMNPKTLNSPKDILAIWVVADTAMLADALTTCLFFVDALILRKNYKFKYLIMKSDFSIERSDDFDAELFT